MKCSMYWMWFALLCAAGLARAESSVSLLDHLNVFECSPVQQIECSGLFSTHAESASKIALLSEGLDSLTLRLRTLKEAQRSIRIQALIFRGDESGLRIAHLLKEKKKQNPKMDIRVVVDAVSNPEWQSQWMYYDLKQHGIEVEGYESLYLEWLNEVSVREPERVNKRFHDKMWIVDAETPDSVAIVGGLNIANEYFRIADKAKFKWRDQDVVIQGAGVQDIAAAFDRNYDYFKNLKKEKPGLFNTDKAWDTWRDRVISKTGPVDVPFVTSKSLRKQVTNAELDQHFRPTYFPARVRFFQNRPRFRETYIQQVYLKLIEAAQEEILIANAYFIPEQDLIDALKRAALRGVKIKIITNSKETNDLPQMAYASRYTFQELMSDNLTEIYEWIGESKARHLYEGTLHAKFAVFDRKAVVVGSYNLDSRSQWLNSETVLVLESNELAKSLAQHVLQKDLPKTRRISLEDAKRYHVPEYAADQFAMYLALLFKGML